MIHDERVEPNLAETRAVSLMSDLAASRHDSWASRMLRSKAPVIKLPVLQVVWLRQRRSSTGDVLAQSRKELTSSEETDENSTMNLLLL